MKLPNFLKLLSAAAFANSAPVFLTAKQVCGRLTISEPTLRRYSATLPTFPKPVWIGPRRKVYKLADVEAYQNGACSPSNG